MLGERQGQLDLRMSMIYCFRLLSRRPTGDCELEGGEYRYRAATKAGCGLRIVVHSSLGQLAILISIQEVRWCMVLRVISGRAKEGIGIRAKLR